MCLMLPLNPNENVFDGSLHESCSETFNLQLNGDISHNEVVEAISHLKQNKAGGPDTFVMEWSGQRTGHRQRSQ